VPALVQLEMQPKTELMSRRNPLVFGDKFHSAMGNG